MNRTGVIGIVLIIVSLVAIGATAISADWLAVSWSREREDAANVVTQVPIANDPYYPGGAFANTWRLDVTSVETQEYPDAKPKPLAVMVVRFITTNISERPAQGFRLADLALTDNAGHVFPPDPELTGSHLDEVIAQQPIDGAWDPGARGASHSCLSSAAQLTHFRFPVSAERCHIGGASGWSPCIR